MIVTPSTINIRPSSMYLPVAGFKLITNSHFSISSPTAKSIPTSMSQLIVPVPELPLIFIIGDKIVLVDTALLELVKSPLIVTVDSMLSGEHPMLSQDEPLNICHW